MSGKLNNILKTSSTRKIKAIRPWSIYAVLPNLRVSNCEENERSGNF